MVKSATSRNSMGEASVAGERDQQDLPHDGADRPHLRKGIRGQLIAHRREAFGDELAVAVNVRSPVEFHVNDGETNARRPTARA